MYIIDCYRSKARNHTQHQSLQRDRLDTPNVIKNDVIRGPGYLGKNDVTSGQANNTGVPPDQKVSKADELTCFFIDFAQNCVVDSALLGYISFQFLPPGGSMGSRYVSQLLFSKKITKQLRTQRAFKFKKNKHTFGLLRCIFNQSKNNQILLHKISHRFIVTAELLTG